MREGGQEEGRAIRWRPGPEGAENPSPNQEDFQKKARRPRVCRIEAAENRERRLLKMGNPNRWERAFMTISLTYFDGEEQRRK
jgi:hypothetical protein